MGARWTQEDLNILRQVYPIEGVKGCMRHFPSRTEAAIMSQVTKLGIKKDVCAKSIRYNEWTDEEKSILRQFYPVGGTKSCAPLLPKRSKNAIAVQASLFGVKKDPKRWQNHPWSTEELSILRRVFPAEGIEGCLPLLSGRTKSAIKLRVHILGLDVKDDKNWTEEELDVLKQVYQAEGLDACLQLLPGRTASDIRKQVVKLGIEDTKGRRNWSEDEVNILRQVYPIEGAKGCAPLLPGRSLAVIRMKASTLKIRKRSGFAHWTQEEVEILRRVYPEEGIKGCLPLLSGRSDKAIIVQAFNRGIKRKRDSPKSNMSTPHN